eukprot:gene20285-biopygen4075
MLDAVEQNNKWYRRCTGETKQTVPQAPKNTRNCKNDLLGGASYTAGEAAGHVGSGNSGSGTCNGQM